MFHLKRGPFLITLCLISFLFYWLFVAREGVMHVWDLETGAAITKFRYDGVLNDFCVNADLLCMDLGISVHGNVSSHDFRLYDFSQAVTKLSAPGACT
jgi:hypothetical protein